MIRKNVIIQIACAVLFLLSGRTAVSAEPAKVLIQGPHVSVTTADLTAELSRIPQTDRAEYLLDVKRVNAMLEHIYVTKELARRAEEMKLTEDPLIRDKLLNAREKVLAQEVVEAHEKALQIPDFSARAKELYLADKEKYKIEPTVKVSHILITWKQRDKETALKKAKEVRAALASGAKTFTAAAEEYSEDTSVRSNHGDLGWIERKRVVKPFADAVFAMKPGELSEPVETNFGYHIIQLHDTKPGGYRTFDEVKPKLMETLKADHVKTARALLLNEIKGDKRVVANTEEILKLNPRAGQPSDTPAAAKPKNP